MATARPLSDLPRFLNAVAVQSKEGAADASNAAALIVVRAIRAQLPTRRLQARAISGGKRTGTGVNYGYREADADKAKYQPTAIVVGRGPVHILENTLGKHKITRTAIRRPAGGRRKPPTIADIVSARQSSASVLRRRRGTEGPTRSEAGLRATPWVTKHPGVRRTSGPFRRGVTSSGSAAMTRWTKVFADESLRVKGW